MKNLIKKEPDKLGMVMFELFLTFSSEKSLMVQLPSAYDARHDKTL